MDEERNPLIRIWTQKPPDDTIKPPEYPARPDLFDEVEWGPYVTSEQAKLAYRLWSLPDGILGKQIHPLDQPYPPPDVQAERESQDMHALAYNVYEHLMHDILLPKPDNDWDESAQMKVAADGSTMEGWTYEEIFPSPDDSESGSESSAEEVITIEGEDVLTARFWTVVRLQAELKRRGLEHRGKSAELRRRLYDDERQRRRAARKDEDVSSLLPRTDLSQWGVPRQDNYMVKVTKDTLFLPLDLYTWTISLSPYNPTYWVSRSYLYYQQGYFDLAIGDAYRAQLLCEVLVNPRDRNRQPGLYTRIWHAIEQHILQTPREDGELPPAVRRMREPNGVNYFVPTVRKALHNIMSLSLKALQCWHDYDYMEKYLTQRVVMPDRDMKAFQARKVYTEDFVAKEKNRKWIHRKLFFFESRAGSISGRSYPYSAKDVHRTSEQFLEKLNREILVDSQLPWKRFQIRKQDDSPGELGVYATEDISQGQIIYAEEPSVRGHLNVTRLVDVRNGHATKPDRCDNCRKRISGDLERRYRNRRDRESIISGEHPHACACALVVDEPIYFCLDSQGDSSEESGQADARTGPGNKTCLQIARELYHFRTCGRNWAWLHNAMRQNWNRHRAGKEKRPTHITHTYEHHGTVLSLALREIFDITLLRREKTGNPYLLAHEIDELLPLQGEYDWADSRFPFTFTANIQVPFDILLRLGVDIFRDLTFDTWVIQIVLRKLLLSVVPWDEERRYNNDFVDQNKTEGIQHDIETERRNTENHHDPTLRALYLFPGFSMFNHTCSPEHNAEWAFDNQILDRIIVWAASEIKRGDEIRIRYRYRPLSDDNARRTLGQICDCSYCNRDPDYYPADETDKSPDGGYGPPPPSESDDNGNNDGDDEGNDSSDNNDNGRGEMGQGSSTRDDKEASTEMENDGTLPEENTSLDQSQEMSDQGGSRQNSALPQEKASEQPGPLLRQMARKQGEAIPLKRKRIGSRLDGTEDVEDPEDGGSRELFAGYKRLKPRDIRAPRASAYFQCRS